MPELKLRLSFVLILAILAASALLTSAAPAFAQNSSRAIRDGTSAAETVTVTGQRPTREERDRIVWDFVYAHAKLAPKIDQLSRWIVPVCPQVRNLPRAYADFITGRIRAIAKGAGAPLREPCKPNIEIIFTSDPQGFINAVAEKNPHLLGYHFVGETQKLATITRPIQAWYATATTNRVETYLDDPYHAAPLGTPGSRLSHGEISVFANILIVADSRKVSGYPVGQIAGYLAMISLSQADAPGNCTELPSILDLMAEDCPRKPDALTDPDKAYLQGLYAMDPDEIGSLQKSAIANTMRRGGAD